MAMVRYTTLDKIAAQFGVTRAAVLKWEHQGAPTTGEKFLAQWLTSRRGNIRESVRLECERILGGPISKPGVSEGEVAALEVEASFARAAKGAKAGDIADSNSTIAQFRDHAAAKLREATLHDDRAEIVYWGKEYRAYEEVCQKGLLLAKKLGIDNGELLKRADAEQYLRGIAYWLVRGIDTTKRRLREHIDAPNPDLVLDANLLPNALVGPMARAVRIDGPVSLPDWAVDCITDAIDDYVENGTDEVKAVLANDVETAQ